MSTLLASKPKRPLQSGLAGQGRLTEHGPGQPYVPCKGESHLDVLPLPTDDPAQPSLH